MTGRAETNIARGVSDALRSRATATRRPDRGLMGDRGMAAVELGVALSALAAALLLAAARS